MVDPECVLGYNSFMKSSAVDLVFTECCFYATLKKQRNTVVDQKYTICYNSSIVTKQEQKIE
jgi:hypothetical protein